MSQIYKPVRIDVMGTCGYGYGLGVHNPGQIHTCDMGLTGIWDFLISVIESDSIAHCTALPSLTTPWPAAVMATKMEAMKRWAKGWAYKVHPKFFIFLLYTDHTTDLQHAMRRAMPLLIVLFQFQYNKGGTPLSIVSSLPFRHKEGPTPPGRVIAISI